MVIVYWLSGGRIYSGHLQIGDITAVISYALMVLYFLMMAQMVILTMPRALECCERVRLVLEHTPEIQDVVAEDPVDPQEKGDEVLAFRNVSFRFADAEEDTLSHLNFVCRRGETTAIIGGTGSGKSTIASLILRFHDVTDGEVCLNGMDIRKMPQHYLRDHLAYVQQKAWLFSGTIASNLRYTDDYDTLLDVAQQEQADDARPELAATVENWDSYDVVFVGYPDWWSDAPMVVYSFLESYDWAGKTLVPFCTSGGSGFGRSLDRLPDSAPGATILDGLHVSGSSAADSGDRVAEWIAGLGL